VAIRRNLGLMTRLVAACVLAGLLTVALPASSAQTDGKPNEAKPAGTKSGDGKQQASPASDAPSAPQHVETNHSIQLGQRNLDYRAIAETIALHDEKGAKTASVFTIAYVAAPQPGQVRPVAFCFNGGPGAAAVFLHLGAAGPRIMKPDSSGRVPAPPPQIVDNPATWLDFTDLVFVDPVGTGFSRGESDGENKDGSPGRAFWNVRSDIQSLDAIVRLWLTKYERWGSPIYLVGESYGGFRIGAMAKSLARDEGIVPSGLVFVSPALDPLIINQDATSLALAAAALPSFAATAASLAGNSNFDAAPVEHFALSDYLVGLANMKGVPRPGDSFIAQIAAMIGLPVDIVRRERGWVSASVLAHELRRDHDQVLSLYDATITRSSPANPWDPTAGDPVLENSIAAYTAAFNTYAPDGLGYHSDLQYRVLPMNIVHQWNFDGSREGQDGLGLSLSGLQTALLDHPATKVLIANGRYDLVTPYFLSRWLIDQLGIPDAVREAIRIKVYDGGHMMYLRPQSLTALSADVRALFAEP
jgi:carboxypeptidase C (cathepsin A)